MYRERSPGHWEVRVYAGINPATGKKMYRYGSVRGTERDARRLEAAMLAERDAGQIPEAPRNMTVYELCQRWLEHAKIHTEPKTYRNYSWASDRIIDALGRAKLHQLRRAHVQQFVDTLVVSRSRYGRPLKSETINTYIRALNAMLNWGVNMGLLAHNPAQGVKSPAKQKEPARVLTHEELAAVLEAAKDTRWYHLIHLTAFTGLRAGEVLGLWWDDVDWRGLTLSVSRALKSVSGRVFLGDLKNHERRRIWLHEETAATLREWQKVQKKERRGRRWERPEHVFTRRDGGWIHPTSPSSALAKIAKRAGVKPFRMHVLRHTHGSHLLAAGWDLAAVSERLGHHSVAFTAQVYAHVIPGIQAQYVRSKNSVVIPMEWQRSGNDQLIQDGKK